MKILVVGSGGREHALVWKLSQSDHVERVYCAPGNPGTAKDGENVAIGADHIDALMAFAQKESVGLTVVGPEAPLVAGMVDRFTAAGLRVFGPTAQAAQLEGSKVFAKDLMRTYNIPTAEFQKFDDAARAAQYIRSRHGPVVVKADGLAAGKGVMVCSTQQEALDALGQIMNDKAFGQAGDRVVVEERLIGQEASLLAFTDGKTIYSMQSAQDHKAIFDGDQGPNTGGMGAYSPAPIVTDELLAEVERDILVPTVHGMKRQRCPFTGVLYAGLMITAAGPKVLEFNVRFGDPEAQPIFMRLKSDLVEVIEAVLDGRLDEVSLEWDPRPAVCVVMASAGYPASSDKGRPITGIDQAEALGDVKVFHAGTADNDGQVVTHGGRVLGVTALGDDLMGAQQRAYAAVGKISFQGMQYRCDIGDKGMAQADSG